MIGVLHLKIVVFFLCLASGLIGVYAARFGSGSGSKRQGVMGFANAFASGVLLAAGLVCMLPDATEQLPLKMCAYVIAGCAILSLILVEELAMWLATPSEDSPSAACYKLVEEVSEASSSTPTNHANSHSKATRKVSVSAAGLKAYDKIKSGARNMSKKLELLKSAPKLTAPSTPSSADSDCFHLMDIDDLLDSEGGPQLSCDGAMMLGSQGLPASKALCLFVALSFHSVMEGIGLGTTKKVSMLISISVAILAHKGLAAFALGSALCKTNLSARRFGVMAIIFSSGTPVGIAIGVVVAENFDGPAVSVCTAIAAGTFLQISLMEIIPSVLQRVAAELPVWRLLRVSFISSGFLLMCLTIYFTDG